jgi:hypothetical protein
MGKQTQFHALPEDMEALLEFVRARDPVVLTLKSSDSSRVDPAPDPAHEVRTLTIWNTDLLPLLEREPIDPAGGVRYYRVNDSLPTLQLWPSRISDWDGMPALLQGRVYGLWGNRSEKYVAWYEAVARWIRKNFARSHLRLGGYIGPAAQRWHQQGGVLLPMLQPPLTPEWRAFVKAQREEMRGQ